jgi:hypothetical protein
MKENEEVTEESPVRFIAIDIAVNFEIGRTVKINFPTYFQFTIDEVEELICKALIPMMEKMSLIHYQSETKN